MGKQKGEMYLFGSIGGKDYNTENRECEIPEIEKQRIGQIIIMGSKIGVSSNTVKPNGKNKYIEKLGNGVTVNYTYIDGKNDLEIDWEYQNPKIEKKVSKDKKTKDKVEKDDKEEEMKEFKYIINHIPLDKDNKGILKDSNGEPKYKRRRGIKIVAETITIHSTGNPNSNAIGERKWLENIVNKRTASFHIVVDEKQAIEVIPLDEKTIHAGNPKGNSTSISIEIVHTGNREKTLENTIELTAKLLKERNWNTTKLKRHYDWNRKNCPSILIDAKERKESHQTWEWFLDEVNKKL